MNVTDFYMAQREPRVDWARYDSIRLNPEPVWGHEIEDEPEPGPIHCVTCGEDLDVPYSGFDGAIYANTQALLFDEIPHCRYCFSSELCGWEEL